MPSQQCKPDNTSLTYSIFKEFNILHFSLMFCIFWETTWQHIEWCSKHERNRLLLSNIQNFLIHSTIVKICRLIGWDFTKNSTPLQVLLKFCNMAPTQKNIKSKQKGCYYIFKQKHSFQFATFCNQSCRSFLKNTGTWFRLWFSITTHTCTVQQSTLWKCLAQF